jgi:hypothetical protein
MPALTRPPPRMLADSTRRTWKSDEKGANPMLGLQFENNEIKRLEQDYLRRRVRYAGDAEKADKMAKDAGTKIRKGELTAENLKAIFRWKHASSRFYARLEKVFDSNPPEYVTTILKRRLPASYSIEKATALA